MGDASQVAGELSDVAHPARGRGPVVVHRIGGGEHGGVPREDGRGRAARESYVCGRTWSWEEENKYIHIKESREGKHCWCVSW